MKRPLLPVTICLLLLLLLVDFTHPSLLFPRLSSEVEAQIGERLVLEGHVLGPPEIKSDGACVEVQALGEKVLLNLPFVPDWQRGDFIQFETRLRKPARYKNPGSFDYRHYLERRGILLTGFIQRPEDTRRLEKGKSALLFLDHLRKKITSIFHQELPEREAGFLSALLIGDSSGVREELWEDFRRTGTAHLIAISGQQIGMIGAAFYFLILLVLKRSEWLMLQTSVREWAGLLTLFPILFYTALSGASPSVVRVAILSTFIFLAPFVEREVDPYSALAAAALGITLFDLSAPFSASFQLSFLAVLGILFFRKKDQIEGRIAHYIISPFWMALGATLMTAPVVATTFHQISLSGILTNLWAVPFSSLLLLLASGSLSVHFMIPAVGFYFIQVTGWLTHFFLKLIHFASHYSWVASFYPTEADLFFLFGAIFVLILFRQGNALACKALAVWVTLGALWLLIPFFQPHSNLEVTFLDVGQGDSSLLKSPTGASLLVDGGGFLIPGHKASSFDVGESVLVPYFKRIGLKRIDRILLSHPHPDHYGGLAAVIRNFPVGEFWSNGQTFPDESFEKLMKILDEKKIPKRILKEGDIFDWESLKVEVLYPSEVNPAKNINDNSLVIRFSFGEASLLFPGDIEKKGEGYLAGGKGGVEATILKIPHHASRTSSSVPFIDTIKPLFAVASLGENNFFHFPHPGILEKYVNRGIKVYRTDRDGAVYFTVPPGFPKTGISIRTTSSGE